MANQVYRIVVFLLLYYLIGLSICFLLLSFHKEEWMEKIYHFFHLVLPHLYKVFFLSLLGGLLFIWIPTLLGILPVSTFFIVLAFISSFSFSILISTLQGWLLIKGYDVIGKNQFLSSHEEIKGENPASITQMLVFFIGFIFILSVILDFLLSFLFPLLTSYDLFVKLVKLSFTLKI